MRARGNFMAGRSTARRPWARGLVSLGMVAALTLMGCGSSSSDGGTTGSSTPRAMFAGDYAGMLALGGGNELVPGDVITESNNWGAFYFSLHPDVTSVRIQIVGAGGGPIDAGNNGGGGGDGTFDMSPAFLAANTASGFWVVLGECGRPSAGETTPITDFMAFNGGGAGTDWSDAEGTYTRAAGGGGASDVRLELPGGDMADPHALVDPCAMPASRIAIVGGGGGATDNGGATGGYGGGFHLDGGVGGDHSGNFGTGGSSGAGGNLGGVLCQGGSGLQDGSEGWAGGGGGGYYGGGAAIVHDGGGGGSGFLITAAGIVEVSSTSGAQGANASTTRHGMFVITVN